jgi:putative transposase
VAAHQKKARDRRGTLIFTDESGFLLAPLARPSLAPAGKTPVLLQRARHRDKLSVAAALTLSPVRGHLGLYYQSFPNGYVNADAYALFLRGLLRSVHTPLVVIQDQGSMHKGPLIREVTSEFPRLDLNMLPPYAPDCNPVEGLWNYVKYHELGNFAPLDVRELNTTVCDRLDRCRNDQERLRSFFLASHLPWGGVTGFI